jgi:hypothetical protein
MTSELLAYLATALMIGVLLGRWLAGWAIWHYVKSKRPDHTGFRTGMFMEGMAYYVVTSAEYVTLMDAGNREDKLQRDLDAARDELARYVRSSAQGRRE